MLTNLCFVFALIKILGTKLKKGISFSISFSKWLIVVDFLSSIKSHLLIARIIALPASITVPAIFLSWSVMPSVASITKTATSQFLIARIERSTANFSTPQSTLDFFLIPAVSTKMNSWPSYLTLESMASRVVPETLETITLSLFKRALTIEDLPTFGLPTIAILIFSDFSSSSI